MPTHFFALPRQQLKMENNKLNIYTQYLMKSTFETIWLFFHRPIGLVELFILYARVQFYTHQPLDYRLISKTGAHKKSVWQVEHCTNVSSFAEGLRQFQSSVYSCQYRCPGLVFLSLAVSHVTISSKCL